MLFSRRAITYAKRKCHALDRTRSALLFEALALPRVPLALLLLLVDGTEETLLAEFGTTDETRVAEFDVDKELLVKLLLELLFETLDKRVACEFDELFDET